MKGNRVATFGAFDGKLQSKMKRRQESEAGAAARQARATKGQQEMTATSGAAVSESESDEDSDEDEAAASPAENAPCTHEHSAMRGSWRSGTAQAARPDRRSGASCVLNPPRALRECSTTSETTTASSCSCVSCVRGPPGAAQNPVTFQQPRALHKARWMAEPLYALKLASMKWRILPQGTVTTRQQVLKIWAFADVITHVYATWRMTCDTVVDSAWNDLTLYHHLRASLPR
ncbi:hypothetical protein AAFF_G00114100 [Aldrovandia affinis]|uniref:Uncharacterized protein n=1 Tax=Aldrovandia affinis TaxID=143900 RepID=A0AAD7RSR3_9TELE|nr:hypothetical protein AAFF_G00114100 [Aldrovandia affinis]